MRALLSKVQTISVEHANSLEALAVARPFATILSGHSCPSREFPRRRPAGAARCHDDRKRHGSEHHRRDRTRDAVEPAAPPFRRPPWPTNPGMFDMRRIRPTYAGKIATGSTRRTDRHCRSHPTQREPRFVVRIGHAVTCSTQRCGSREHHVGNTERRGCFAPGGSVCPCCIVAACSVDRVYVCSPFRRLLWVVAPSKPRRMRVSIPRTRRTSTHHPRKAPSPSRSSIPTRYPTRT